LLKVYGTGLVKNQVLSVTYECDCKWAVSFTNYDIP